MSDNALLWTQTITLILTGGVIAYYTLETHKIRKDAAHQNELISKQVDLMFQSLKFEIGREELASEPFFKWGYGESQYRSGIKRADKSCKFLNEGGPVTNLEVKTSDDVQASIVPKDRVGESKEGEVIFYCFTKTDVPDVKFEIHYTTRLNKRGKKSFVLPSSQGVPQDDPTGNSKT